MKRAREKPTNDASGGAGEPPKKKRKKRGPKQHKGDAESESGHVPSSRIIEGVLSRYHSAMTATSSASSEPAKVSKPEIEAPLMAEKVTKGQKKKETKMFQSDEGEDMLRWMIFPRKLPGFFRDYWGKKPLFIQRGQTDYYQLESLFSKAFLKKEMRRSREIVNDENFTVCRIVDGKKESQRINDDALFRDSSETSSSSSSASKMTPDKMIWKLYSQGYTLQVFQPQRWSPQLARVVQLLESAFGSLVGCNAYLTPPASQGLAPHWDDVDVFILQLEGRKDWNLFLLPDDQSLPRDYSKDLDINDLGEPDLRVTLNPGDLLYFPRGVIHYATTSSSLPSHHLTISMYQHQSWFDFMSIAIPHALQNALSSDVAFRKGLPVNFANFMGSAFHFSVPDDDDEDEDEDDGGEKEREKKKKGKKGERKRVVSIEASDEDRPKLRRKFINQFKELFDKLLEHMDLDSSADLFAEDFHGSRMTPSTPSLLSLLSSHGHRPSSLDDLVSLIDPSFVRMAIGPFSPDSQDSDPQVSANDDSDVVYRNLDDDDDDDDDGDKEDDPRASQSTPSSAAAVASKRIRFEDDDNEEDDKDDSGEKEDLKNKEKGSTTSSGNNKQQQEKKKKKKRRAKRKDKKQEQEQEAVCETSDAMKGERFLPKDREMMEAQGLCVKISHSFENESMFHMKSPTPLEFVFLPLETAPAVSSLFVSFPSFVCVRDLVESGLSLEHIQLLFDFCFLQTKSITSQ